jgi:hypothetical protein
MTDRKLCRLCGQRPSCPRYLICQRCRHGPPVPCPTCEGTKRPEARACRNCANKRRGPDHAAWKGGRILDLDGYVRVFRPTDERANCGRYMKEHQLVMEEVLGRRLLPGESVHHKNGDRADNRPENLELWATFQPAGQRVTDLLAWARVVLERYADKQDDDVWPGDQEAAPWSDVTVDLSAAELNAINDAVADCAMEGMDQEENPINFEQVWGEQWRAKRQLAIRAMNRLLQKSMSGA